MRSLKNTTYMDGVRHAGLDIDEKDAALLHYAIFTAFGNLVPEGRLWGKLHDALGDAWFQEVAKGNEHLRIHRERQALEEDLLKSFGLKDWGELPESTL
jgi:hypothetical protein